MGSTNIFSLVCTWVKEKNWKCQRTCTKKTFLKLLQKASSIRVTWIVCECFFLELILWHLIPTHSYLELMVFFGLMHQCCTAMVHCIRKERHMVSMQKFMWGIWCIQDQPQCPTSKLFCFNFPNQKWKIQHFPWKNVETLKTEQSHIFRQPFFSWNANPSWHTFPIHFQVQDWELWKTSPSVFKQNINGHRRGKKCLHTTPYWL